MQRLENRKGIGIGARKQVGRNASKKGKLERDSPFLIYITILIERLILKRTQKR